MKHGPLTTLGVLLILFPLSWAVTTTGTGDGTPPSRPLTEPYPEGFSPVEGIRHYGTPDSPRADGTIFDYINGGGVVFLDHGLRETRHVVCTDSSGILLTIDIHDMGTAEQVLAALRDEMICPPGHLSCDIGDVCRAYHYEPEFLLYCAVSSYLLFLSTSDDTVKSQLTGYARELADRLTRKGTVP